MSERPRLWVRACCIVMGLQVHGDYIVARATGALQTQRDGLNVLADLACHHLAMAASSKTSASSTLEDVTSADTWISSLSAAYTGFLMDVRGDVLSDLGKLLLSATKALAYLALDEWAKAFALAEQDVAGVPLLAGW